MESVTGLLHRTAKALTAGSAMDGNEGSLCVLAGSQPAGAKSPFLPASQGGGGCNLGLNCVSLQVCCVFMRARPAPDGAPCLGSSL